MSVLIVEDHALNRKVISGMLSARGLEADEAPGGLEALEKLRTRDYRLIFTDLHMPGMDGFEFTRKLRASAASATALVVGVTADAMADSRARCLRAGMDEVLTKPILSRDLDALLGRLETLAAARELPGPEAATGSGIVASGPTPEPAADLPSAGRSPADAGADESSPAKDESFVAESHVMDMDAWVLDQDPGFWDRAVAQYRLDTARLAETMREGMAGDRPEEACAAAHALKGLSLMLGFRRIGMLCLELEADIREGRRESWSARLLAIEAAVEPSVDLLRALVAEGANRETRQPVSSRSSASRI